jgi:hypothetical protein
MPPATRESGTALQNAKSETLVAAPICQIGYSEKDGGAQKLKLGSWLRRMQMRIQSA